MDNYYLLKPISTRFCPKQQDRLCKKELHRSKAKTLQDYQVVVKGFFGINMGFYGRIMAFYSIFMARFTIAAILHTFNLVLCLTFTLTIPKLGHCPLTRPSATLSPDGGEGAKLTIYSASPPARVGVRGSPAQLESYFRYATLVVASNLRPPRSAVLSPTDPSPGLRPPSPTGRGAGGEGTAA